MNVDLKSPDTHFEFGKNWRDFLRHVDEDAIREAEEGLRRLIPLESLEGARFIDIGCGSGLHTLAALRLGAAQTLSIDIDGNSVKAARELLSRFAPSAPAEVRELSVFDAHPSDLGKFDIVYSWGVLHHTGAMWEAISRASMLVRDGGLFVLALYQKRPTCGAWALEKRIYTRSGAPVRAAIRSFYKAALYLRLLIGGRHPGHYIRNYKSARGMNFHTDVHDWLGGYPYQSASPEEVRAYLADAGFVPVREHTLEPSFGLFGTGCAEYAFKRTA